MESLPPPPALSLNSKCLAESWKVWRQRFELFMEATSLNAKREPQKVAILLHVIGEDCLQIYNTFDLPEESRNVAAVLKAFEDYFVPQRNTAYERQKLFLLSQRIGQKIDDFVTEVRKQLKCCDYGDQEDSVLVDQLIRGICDKGLRERLLRTSGLDSAKAIEICRASEASKAQVEFYTSDDKSLNLLKKRGNGGMSGKVIKEKWKSQQESSRGCRKCGRVHSFRNCPAFGKNCRKCGKLNHFAIKCSSSRPVRDLEIVDDESKQSELLLGTVSTNTLYNSWTKTILINDIPIDFKVDTGAMANVLPFSLFAKVSSNENLRSTNVKLTTYTGERVELLGSCRLPCKKVNDEVTLEFLVTKKFYQPILGLDACLNKLKILSSLDETGSVLKLDCTDLLNEYSDVFEGLGKLPGRHKIVISENSIPIVVPSRKVPFAVQDKLKLELDRMVKMGVITKVTEPTDWVSPLVIIHKKNGALRICLDPGNLNSAIKRSHYTLPTFEEITSKLSGAKYFSVLDAVSAFWQLELDPPSSYLCTFSTPFGRYRFLRVPYGITSAPELFQRVVAEMLEDIPNAENFFDDIIVWGSTVEQHDEALKRVLDKCRKFNLKLSKEKSEIRKTKITFLGHCLSSEGISIDPVKIDPIVNMPKPKDKKDLQRYLGMINYLTKFLPNLSTQAAPLRELLRKDSSWQWNESYDQIMNNINKSVASAPILGFFDPKKQIELHVDASPFGLGAVIQQESKPIAYSSTTLTSAQRNYAHIEKELLAIVYGCKKFHQFLFGCKFKVYSDHKPLISMSKKPLSTLSSRMQRMFLQLQCYDMEIVYKPGKEMFLPDTLSRAPLDNNFPTPEEDTLTINVLKYNYMSDVKLLEIKEATETDLELNLLKDFIVKGWPRDNDSIDPQVKKYWQYRDELCFSNGLVLKLDRIVIPASKRQEILLRLHEGHFGIVKTLEFARSCVFWPGMTNDIKRVIDQCAICAQFQISNKKEPEIQHEIPLIPWYKVGMDFFYFNGCNFVEVIDYYSKYIEVQKVTDLKATSVIPAIKSIFARHGIPNLVVSDGGPPFNSYQFKEFASDWKFQHIKVSAKYPKSNGMAERGIQSVKQIFRKTLAESRDPYLALLNYRAAPIIGMKCSPAELLMKRKLATLLPNINLHQGKPSFRPRSPKAHRNLKFLPEFESGSSVFVQRGIRDWEPGVIVKRNEIPRSYSVKTSRGLINRNRIHLRQNNTPISLPSENTEEFYSSDHFHQEPVCSKDSDSPRSSTSASTESVSRSKPVLPAGPSDVPPPRVSSFGRIIRPVQRFQAGTF